MDFKKYSSIENHYRQKWIDKMINHNPDAIDCKWVAREKLDGANIQLVFTPNEPMLVGKRTSYLTKEDSFFDIWNTLDRYKRELDIIQNECNTLGDMQFRIYGEIYGPGINGRIDYGDTKKIALYDMEVNGELETQETLEYWFDKIGLTHLLPKFFNVGTLSTCLQTNVEDQNIEGIVIKPWDRNFFFQGTERFIVKKKSAAFNDKEKGEDEPKGPTVKDEMYNLNVEFRKYITKNRVLDVFAKHGQIEDMKQIGQYIALVLDDAKVDFLKDVTVPPLNKKQEKALYNVGGLVVNLLKEFM